MNHRYDIENLTTLCKTAKLAVKAEREQFKKALQNASTRRSNRARGMRWHAASDREVPCAPSHHLLAALVPLVRSLDKYLAQVRTKQSPSSFASAPVKFVCGLMDYFITGHIQVDEAHPLWRIPLTTEVLLMSAYAAGYKSSIRPYGEPTHRDVLGALSGSTLGELRASYILAVRKVEEKAATTRKSRLRQFEAVAIKVRSMLSEKEFALLCEHRDRLNVSGS
jgi:hypothetical protein